MLWSICSHFNAYVKLYMPDVSGLKWKLMSLVFPHAGSGEPCLTSTLSPGEHTQLQMYPISFLWAHSAAVEFGLVILQLTLLSRWTLFLLMLPIQAHDFYSFIIVSLVYDSSPCELEHVRKYPLQRTSAHFYAAHLYISYYIFQFIKLAKYKMCTTMCWGKFVNFFT